MQKLLAEESARSLVHARCVVSKLTMMTHSPDEITRQVKRDLVDTAVDHAAKHKLLDAPDCVTMEEATSETHFHTRLYMMTPAELEMLLKKAYDAGVTATLNFELGGVVVG